MKSRTVKRIEALVRENAKKVQSDVEADMKKAKPDQKALGP